MKHLGDLLVGLQLPEVDASEAAICCDFGLVHDLGAGLPAGHLHLWGGPEGAGKTSFLLSLLTGAAVRRRRVVYATYHLSAQSLALRLLAMVTRVEIDAMLDGNLSDDEARRAAHCRLRLSRLPFSILEARGFSASSLEDRLVRMPYRAEVLAVDYLQAVIRKPGTDLGAALRDFTSLASRHHVAIVCALEAGEQTPMEVCGLADRTGFIAPSGGSGLRRAEVIRNRYGARPSVPLRFDPSTGTLLRLPHRSRPAEPTGT
ncbi:MAG: DnaB-like helicase C-terminal domain-containing protein [Planctomycetota bacterium]|jgi:archaellum biogenesis ATPase FlaH